MNTVLSLFIHKHSINAEGIKIPVVAIKSTFFEISKTGNCSKSSNIKFYQNVGFFLNHFEV